jgi:hypothetical protein
MQHGGGALLPYMVAMHPFDRTRGVQRRGQGGHKIGPNLGQISKWAKKQSWSPHNTLQIVLRVHIHYCYELADNQPLK